MGLKNRTCDLLQFTDEESVQLCPILGSFMGQLFSHFPVLYCFFQFLYSSPHFFLYLNLCSLSLSWIIQQVRMVFTQWLPDLCIVNCTNLTNLVDTLRFFLGGGALYTIDKADVDVLLLFLRQICNMITSPMPLSAGSLNIWQFPFNG